MSYFFQRHENLSNATSVLKARTSKHVQKQTVKRISAVP